MTNKKERSHDWRSRIKCGMTNKKERTPHKNLGMTVEKESTHPKNVIPHPSITVIPHLMRDLLLINAVTEKPIMLLI